MAFDVAGAYNAGYSDAEIADFLSQQVGFDTNAARQSGYSDRELVNFLAENQPEGGFGAAFESGVAGVKSAGAALLGRTGVIDTETAEQYMAEREAEQRMTFKPTEEGWLEAPLTKTAETLGQSLPYMAAPIVGAGAGALAVKSAPVWLTAGLGATALSGLQFTGTNLERQIEEQDIPLEETDLLKAGATAVPQALLDTVALRFIPGVRRLLGAKAKELTEEQLKNVAKRAIATNLAAAGAKTASAESLTEVGQQALERFQAGLEVLDEEGRDELTESAIGGGVLGFLFGVPGGVNVRGRARDKLAEAEARRQQAAADAEAGTEQQTLEGTPPTTPPTTPTAPEADFLTAEVSREDRQRAVQTQLDEQAPPRPAVDPVQGDLFLDAANRELRAGRPAVAAGLFDAADTGPRTETRAEEPDVTTPETPAGAAPGQLALPLIGGRTASQVEIEKYLEKENDAAIEGARRTRAKREEQGAQAEAQAEKDRLRFESDLAEADGRVRSTKRKTLADNRLELLLPIVADPQVTNIPKAFGRALQQAGITDLDFYARERKLIERAYAVRDATAPEPAVDTTVDTTVDTAPSTSNEMDVAGLIPERAVGTREPEQMGLPGVMGKGAAKRAGKTRPVEDTTAPEPTAPEPTPIVDDQALDTLKLPKASMVRRRLLGKDLSDPVQRQQVNKELRSAVDNTDLPKQTRDAIRDVIEQSEFTRQGEMFDPAGGILPQTTQRTGARDGTTEPDNEGGAAVSGAVTPTVQPMPPIPPTLKGAAKKHYERHADQVASDMAANPFEALQSTTAPPVRDQADRVYLTPKEKILQAVAGDIYSGENTRAANNVRNTLPESDQAVVDRFLDEFKDMGRRGKTTMAWLDAIQELDAEVQKQVNDDLSPLVNTGAMPLQNRLDETVVSQLRNNNLTGALDELSGRLKGPMAKIARVLANMIGDTRVVMVDDATMRRRIFERTGKVESDVKGVYFGEGNVILINTEFGLDAHTLLHEATHAAINRTLDNKAHPLTRQLTKLFDAVQGGLDTAYGATDIKEFAAEFMSNPEFRSKLDRLHPGGERVSALQKIVNSIMNFLRNLAGMQSKGVESAFNVADNLIYSMLQPGQTALQPTTTMKEASFLREGDKPIAAVTLADKALPFLNQEKRDGIDKFIQSTAAGSLKKLVKGSLTLNALVDMAKNRLPSATRVEETIRKQSGTENKRRQMIEPIEQEANQFAKKASTGEMTTFNDVVYGSTIDGVDPTKLRETYAGNREKLEAWDALQSKWGSISPEGKKLYTRIRDSYKTLFDEILKVIDERLDSVSADPETSRKVKKDILAKLKDEAGKIDPYFPLTREGDYWISYSVRSKNAENGFFVEAFDTPAARDRAIEDLKGDSGVFDVELYAKNQPINYANAPSGSFMNSVFTTLNANNVDPKVTQDLMTLFLNSLPASSFAQSFRRRKGTGGYKRDAVGAFRSKVYNISRQLSNIEYSAKLNDVRDQIIQEGNEAYRQGDVAAREYADEFVARINYAVNPQVPRWSQALTSYGFLATLGFNLSSAVVNLSQIPLMVMPYYGGKYGYGKTMGAIGRAVKLYTNSGFTQDRVTILGDTKRMRVAPSIQNYNFNDPNLPNNLKPYKYLVEIAEDLGQMNRSQVYDILEVGQNENALTKVNKYSGFIFHHGERMNREVALAAAYDLELQQLGANPTPDQMRDAARRAVDLTELTNGGIAATAAPRIAQNALGRVMFMYKRYGVSMYYTLFKMTRDMLRGESPEVRAAARAQIGGVFLSSVALAGVQGLPMYGTLALIYNMFKEDDEDDADTEVRKFLGEGLYKGPVNLLTGVDVASRIGLSDLLFRANPMQREQEPMAEIMELIGGPVYSVANRALRGVKDIREGEVQRGVEQILPSAFGNVLKTLRFATEGANTRRGDPIVEDIGPASAVGQFFGFAPAEYIRQLEINAAQKGLERYKNTQRSKLMRQYYLAMREGDAREARQIMEEISEFSQRNPRFAITMKSLRDSMSQHNRTTSKMYGGVTYSNRYLPEFLEAMREYDGE